jgi:hypothetical protein
MRSYKVDRIGLVELKIGRKFWDDSWGICGQSWAASWDLFGVVLRRSDMMEGVKRIDEVCIQNRMDYVFS